MRKKENSQTSGHLQLARVGIHIGISPAHRVGLGGTLHFQAFVYLAATFLHVHLLDYLLAAYSGNHKLE